MKQQEVNLFSEGLNLDTHPIAMSNQLLAGALNATMVTMNGNELILQNDMGNGKVEMANLPAGYVPVGMLEFGGIVYVASYNPLTNQSLIGSFPSPERNISSTEDEAGREITFKVFSEDDVITTVVLKLLLTNDVIRPGDKFSILMSDLTHFEKLLQLIDLEVMKLSVCTMDSNGSLIDITLYITANYTYNVNNKVVSSFIYCPSCLTPQGTKYTLDDILFNIHKNKVVGELYLKLTLNIPNTISYYISGEKTETGSKRYKIYFNDVLNIDKYRLKVIKDIDGTSNTFDIDVATHTRDDNGLLCFTSADIPPSEFTYKDSESNIFDTTYTCEITPHFNGLSDANSGWLPSYTYTAQININKIATGDIEVNEFRYYNNTDDNVFIFNYTLTSYLKTTLHIKLINLCTVNRKDITSNLEEYIPHKLTISENGMYYGNVLSSIRYTNIEEEAEEPSLDKGQFYIGYLEIVVGEQIKDNAETYSYIYSKPFFVITSSITNYLYTGGLKNYVNGDQSNNSPYVGDSDMYDDYLALPCKITWNLDLIENNLKSEVYSTGLALPFNTLELYIKHLYKLTGNCVFKINPKINLRLKLDNPFLGTIEASFDSFEVQTNTEETAPTLSYEVATSGTLPYNVITSDINFEGVEMALKDKRTLDYSDYLFNKDKATITVKLDSHPIYSRFASKIKQVNEDRTGYIIRPYLNTNTERNRICGLLFIQDFNREDSGEDEEFTGEPLFNSANAYFAIWHDRKSDAGSHKYCNIHFILAETVTENMIPWDTVKKPNGKWYIGSAENAFENKTNAEKATSVFLIKSLKSSSIDWKPMMGYLKSFLETGLPAGGSTPYMNFSPYSYDYFPTLLFMLAASTDWDFGFKQDLFNSHGGASYKDGTYDYCIPLLMCTNGMYYPLNDFGHAASTKDADKKGYIDKMLKVFEDIGIVSNELQTYNIKQCVASDLNYLYTKDATYNFSFNVKGFTKVTVTGYDTTLKYQVSPSLNKVIITTGTNGNLKLPELTLIDEYNNLKPYDYAVLTCPINNISIESDALLFISYGNNSMLNLYVLLDTTKKDDSEGSAILLMDGEGRLFNPGLPYFRSNDGKFYPANVFADKTFDASGSDLKKLENLRRIAKYFTRNILKVDLLDCNPDYCIYLNQNKLASITDKVKVVNGLRKDCYGFGSDSWSLTKSAGMPFLDILFVDEYTFTK